MFRFGIHPYLIVLALILFLIIGLFCFGLIKLFIKASKKQRIILTSVIALCVVFVVGWFLPIGTLTGTWQLSSGFSANPRNITPAPHMIQFFDDGTGYKIDHDGYEIDFEWHITTFEEYFFEELKISTRPGWYIVRLYGFGTRLTIENSLRGEWSIGRFDLPQDYRATYRRSF
jgi:hypothetical protein